MASLDDVLRKVKRGPVQVDERGEGGAILALALHCLMVKDGYLPFPLDQQHPASPVLDWNNRYKDEWVFEFTRKGYDSIFILHCSLQAATGKMFIQGREKDNTSHVHNLGLQVDKYIAGVDRCKLSTWEGVFESQDVLDEMFREYIAEPLRKQAIPCKEATTTYGRSLDWLQQWRSSLQNRDVLVAVCVGLGAAALCTAAAYAYKHRNSAS